MKFLKNSLAAVAFIVASLTAFAFNAPEKESANIKHALNPDTQQWEPIPGAVLGQDYRCDAQVETTCTVEFNESGQMEPGTREDGEYSEI